MRILELTKVVAQQGFSVLHGVVATDAVERAMTWRSSTLPETTTPGR